MNFSKSKLQIGKASPKATLGASTSGMVQHKGKGSSSQLLPNRHALNQLTGGDATKRTINDYSKEGSSIVQNGPSFADPDK